MGGDVVGGAGWGGGGGRAVDGVVVCWRCSVDVDDDDDDGLTHSGGLPVCCERELY